MKKEKVFFIVPIVEQNFFHQVQSLIVELDGHPLLNHYQVLLKLKPTILSAWKELSIIALSAELITDMFLMMDQENRERDFVAMAYV